MKTVPMRVVYQSSQCAVTDKGLRQLSNEMELRQMMAPRLTFGGPESPAVNTDFSSEYIILAAWGQQPTAGYTLTLQGKTAPVKNGVVHLPLEFGAPAPDSFQAQMLTSPCLVVALPKGGYHIVMAGNMQLSINN